MGAWRKGRRGSLKNSFLYGVWVQVPPCPPLKQRLNMKYFITALMLAVTATPAIAATCADKTIVVERLETRYNEKIVANMLLPSFAIVEIYASPGYATWTIAVIDPKKNLFCLQSNGKGFASYNEQINLLDNSKSL